MCSHYESPGHEEVSQAFGVAMPAQGVLNLWPGYQGPFLRASLNPDDDDAPAAFELMQGTFGLIPAWSKDAKMARRTYNARSETAAEKPSFRHAWRQAQHCIIPAQAIYEPDWRSGKAVATRITRRDQQPMGIAGLWERWTRPTGQAVYSFAMLTVNADDHGFMRDYHRPEDEKRMVVILPRGLYRDWLGATAEESRAFMRRYPADRMVVA